MQIFSEVKKSIVFFGILFLTIIILHLFPVNFFQSFILNSAFENMLHPYGFACVAVVLLNILYPSFLQSPLKHKSILLLSTVLLCTVVGLASEIFQHFFNRDTSFDDLLNDILGSVSGTLLFIAINRQSFIKRKAVRCILLFTGILILGYTSIPFTKGLFIITFRNHQYPILFNFENRWEKTFIEAQSSDVSFVNNESLWSDNLSMHSLKVELHDGEFPGVSFSDVYPDWSRADTFSFALYSLSDSPFTLSIRINDSNHNNEYTDRFNANINVNPGKNHYSFAITNIAKSLKTRTMNLKQVETVILFGLKSNSGKSILIDSIRLNR
jgi:uncharacterized membrane protein